MKQNLILKYRNQLRSYSDQKLEIPNGNEDKFWEWFTRKSRIFGSKKIRKNLRETSIPILDNSCFKNTYRISKGFVKRLFYYEGFSFCTYSEYGLKHAFNVCKHGKVNDYSLMDKHEVKQDFYVGVKIPLSFARKVYKALGDYKFSQYSLLVAYFMYVNGLENYLNYAEP